MHLHDNEGDEGEVTQSCPTLSDRTDFSLPGSSIRGIFQARVVQWVAISFSYMIIVNANCISFYTVQFSCSVVSDSL